MKKNSRSTVDLIDNKIGIRITNFSKNSQQNNSENVTNESDKEMPKKRYIFRKKDRKFVDDLRLT